MDVLAAAYGQPAGLLYEVAKPLSQPVFPNGIPTPVPSSPGDTTPNTPPPGLSSWKLVALGGGLAVVAIAGALIYVRINKW
jgi:hypothetical protein